MRRERSYLIRLSEDEYADLRSRADAEGIAKADVIRKALGWEPEGLIKPDSEKRPRRRRAKADSDVGPGERSLDELMRRLNR